MTVTYANGSTVDALLLSSEGKTIRVAIAGEDDIRVFSSLDGVWCAEDGEPVQLKFAWEKDAPAPVPEESHFICSKELGHQLISNLMNGSERNEGDAGPLFVFSGEKRRVRITVLHEQQRRAS